MTKRDISADFFEDSDIMRLECDTYRVAVYLLHGPHVKHLPIFKASAYSLCGKYRISEERWSEMVEELASIGVSFEGDWVIVDSPYLEHGISKSSRNDQAIRNEIAKLPEVLQKRLLTISRIDEKLNRNLAEFLPVEKSNAPGGNEAAPEQPEWHGEAVSAGVTPDATEDESPTQEIPQGLVIEEMPEFLAEVTTSTAPVATFGKAEVNEILALFKEKMGLTRLDGTEAKNRRAANTLLTRLGSVEAVERLIDGLAAHEFYRRIGTSLEWLMFNQGKIEASMKASLIPDDGQPIKVYGYGEERSFR